jgi:hypothetical protein
MNRHIPPGHNIPSEHFNLPTHRLGDKDADNSQLQDMRINLLRHVKYRTQVTPAYQTSPTRLITRLHPSNVLPYISVMQLHLHWMVTQKEMGV